TWPQTITLQAGRNKPPQRNTQNPTLRPACSVINKKPGSTEWCEAEKRHPRDLPSRRGEKPHGKPHPPRRKPPTANRTHQISRREESPRTNGPNHISRSSSQRFPGHGKVEIGVGVGLVGEGEVPPFDGVVVEAGVSHDVAEEEAVVADLVGDVGGFGGCGVVEAVEAGAHVDG